jgi:hypothetical protein
VKTTNKSSGGGNGTTPPGAFVSAFADADALKKATAAKLGKLKSSTERASAELVLQKPLSTWFFMTPDDDDMLFSGGTWTDPETKELYFVVPDMWNHSQLEGAVRPTLFVPYVTAAVEGPQVRGIWPVSSATGNTYTDSIHAEVLPKSRVAWVRIWTVKRLQKYRFQEAEDDYGKPTWLEKTIFEQLDIVFPSKRQIQNEGHEVIERLRGRNRSNPPAPAVDPN